MGEFTDKVSAAANKAVGSAKEALGDHNRDPDLKAEGEAQQAKGTAQEVRGSVKGALGDEI